MSQSPRMKFMVAGLVILAAVVYLIVSSTQASAQYFLTIDELNAKGESILNTDVRVLGAVDGDTIQYDPETLTLTFEVAQMPADSADLEEDGGLGQALHLAVSDPTRARMKVVYVGAKPDLLRHEAQAIMTGQLGADGTFVASELLLKCPTKYEEAVPQDTEG